MLITCPSCHKQIKTKAESLSQLPEMIACPGCTGVSIRESFIPKMPEPTQPPPPEKRFGEISYAADAAPITIPEASPKPIKPQRKPSSIDVMFDIGHTRTASYAQVLWVTSLVASMCADFWLVIYSIGNASALGAFGIVGVHLILLPMIRIALECAVNVERIAKR